MKESDRPLRVMPVSHAKAAEPSGGHPALGDPSPSVLRAPKRSERLERPDNKAAGVEKPEQRAASRYPFSASAEVFEPQTRTRISGRASDLGVGGCYIDTVSTFPVATAVRLRLTLDGKAFHAAAVVTYMAPGMGMGLAFTRMSPEHANVLSSWLGNLSGELPAEPDWEAESQLQPRPSQPPSELDRAADLRDLLKAVEAARDLVDLLTAKRILTEMESLKLRQKLPKTGL